MQIALKLCDLFSRTKPERYLVLRACKRVTRMLEATHADLGLKPVTLNPSGF